MKRVFRVRSVQKSTPEQHAEKKHEGVLLVKGIGCGGPGEEGGRNEDGAAKMEVKEKFLGGPAKVLSSGKKKRPAE